MDRLLHSIDHRGPFQDMTGMLGSLERLIADGAGVHQVEVLKVEIAHRPGHRPDVALILWLYQNHSKKAHAARNH